MKKKNLILSLLILIFITGCGAPKTELDKFKHYLKKNGNFNCNQDICTVIRKTSNSITFVDEINFNTNTMTKSNNFTSQLGLSTTMTTTYNWVTNSGTFYSKTLDIEINAIYDYATDEFNCSSDYEDKEIVKLNCDSAKLVTKELKTSFEKIISNSKTNYFNN